MARKPKRLLDRLRIACAVCGGSRFANPPIKRADVLGVKVPINSSPCVLINELDGHRDCGLAISSIYFVHADEVPVAPNNVGSEGPARRAPLTYYRLQ